MHFSLTATLVVILIFMNDKAFSLGGSNEEKSDLINECAALCEKLNLTSKRYLTYLNKTPEQNYNKCVTVLNENDAANNTVEKLGDVYEIFIGDVNFLNFSKSNSIKLAIKNGTCKNFIKFMNNRKLERFEKLCDCHVRFKEKKQKKSRGGLRRCSKRNRKFVYNATNWSNVESTLLKGATKKFSIRNEQPEYINISLNNTIQLGKTFLWYGSYANTTTPKFKYMKILHQNFTVNVTPNVNYLICLVRMDKYIQVNIYDCQPFKTTPLPEDQAWIVKKSIPILVISIFILFILAMVMGAFILYLLVHKNPSLIRGSKRVIEVKRQDKAHILIMPRDYESLPQADSPLSLSTTNNALRPAISTLSCDSISTVSYVSANQPTPVEILTYRLNKLRELFQMRNNNIPALISSIPRPFSMSLNQRLPADIDLLFEYEWYTITTTLTTTGTATEECIM